NTCRSNVVEIRGDINTAIRKKASSTKQIISAEGLSAVMIEAQYKVDEYSILILSAKEGRALEEWLVQHEYKMPEGASGILQSYIRQGRHFFVAKVDLNEQERLGYPFRGPIQVA